ncbi:expressed unknown protein [Ectocarpus siliculosus]|uniref:Uncharacterized protein n=1 Tax=Ectocarpus siliculosus TaxID=2880 RepID=D7FT47_ECTSI|nr:expressed unknown protein [Ectocarpus siliculosus]|eukprot:CBJ49219.1 expressed unknown protein [Ectocarpus siliculosus]
MVDYSKWDNLDSDDSGSGSDGAAAAAKTKQQPPSARKAADDKRQLDQAEALRLQGNSAYELGDVSKAIAAYDAQLRVLEGRKDEAAVEMTCGALLNQASGFISLKKFKEAEARCSRLLASATPRGGTKAYGGAEARTRALHFRGFARFRLGLFDGACSDLRSSLAAGTSSGDEARALLLEAEAGAAMSSCPDPEAEGREHLRQGRGREAAKSFRDAASRARRRKDAAGAEAGEGAVATTVALSRNLRLEGIAVAMAGDPPSAEMLLRTALRDLRVGGGGGRVDGGGGGAVEEEGLTLAALGSLLAQRGKHADALEPLREAVAVLDEAIAGVSANEGGVANSSAGTNARSSPPTPSITEGRITALTRTLTGTLAFLGTSLLAPEVQPSANYGSNGSSTTTTSSGGVTPGVMKGGAEKVTVPAPGFSCDDKGPIVADSGEAGSSKEADEAIDVLKRAHEMLKAETVAMATAGPGQKGGLAGVYSAVGESRGEADVRKQTAKVLDTLSEAYGREKRWERARLAAEQSLTAWRSLGVAGRVGAAASLLSLGHLLLQLHGVGAGFEEASARWEEAATCFKGCAERPSVEAEVRLKIAGYYTKVARSDPARLESLEGKISAHYSEAAVLFARERDEKTSSLKRAAEAVAAAQAPRDKTAEGSGSAEPVPPLPPPLVDSLEPDGRSRWELAEQEAFAWEGYAGAAGEDHEAAVTALAKAEKLLDHASVSDKDERWTLRKVGVLHSLALALARSGEHAMAENKLLEAIRELQQLDGVDSIAEACVHKGTLTDLYKYLAIVRRARGDFAGAKAALAKVETLGGCEGSEELEGLNRLLAESAVSVG